MPPWVPELSTCWQRLSDSLGALCTNPSSSSFLPALDYIVLPMHSFLLPVLPLYGPLHAVLPPSSAPALWASPFSPLSFQCSLSSLTFHRDQPNMPLLSLVLLEDLLGFTFFKCTVKNLDLVLTNSLHRNPLNPAKELLSQRTPVVTRKLNKIPLPPGFYSSNCCILDFFFLSLVPPHSRVLDIDSRMRETC